MIYHDKVQLSIEVETGEYDSRGQPIMELVTATVPAEVIPLTTETISDSTRAFVASRYQLVLAPVLDIAPDVGDGMSIKWGAYENLVPEGTVERHMFRGRLHHYELVTAQVN